MTVDPKLAQQAIEFALERYPEFAQFGPSIAYRALFQGGAWIVQYESEPPRDFPNSWAFLEAAVKHYRRAAGV